jgi:hypothetical protein
MTHEGARTKRIQIGKTVFHSFMDQLRNMPEEGRRYFPLGCADRLIVGVMISKRGDMMHHEYERHIEVAKKQEALRK